MSSLQQHQGRSGSIPDEQMNTTSPSTGSLPSGERAHIHHSREMAEDVGQESSVSNITAWGPFYCLQTEVLCLPATEVRGGDGEGKAELPFPFSQ